LIFLERSESAKALIEPWYLRPARSNTMVFTPFFVSTSPKASPSFVAPSTLGKTVLKSELFVDMADKVCPFTSSIHCAWIFLLVKRTVTLGLSFVPFTFFRILHLRFCESSLFFCQFHFLEFVMRTFCLLSSGHIHLQCELPYPCKAQLDSNVLSQQQVGQLSVCLVLQHEF